LCRLSHLFVFVPVTLPKSTKTIGNVFGRIGGANRHSGFTVTTAAGRLLYQRQHPLSWAAQYFHQTGTDKMSNLRDLQINHGIMDMNPDYTRAIPDEWRKVARIFTALGDEHRQRILLTFEPGERLNVGQLVAVSTLSRSAVSHHLKILREAGVLESRKEGKEVYFWVNKQYLDDTIGAVLTYLRNHS
jgi:DNA-binding transcriptional ArsR family regulator